MSNEQIKKLYQNFFEDFGIDPVSGELRNCPPDKKLRFATMPYIGSNYFSAKKKILFIGMDIGKDEKDKEKRYHSLEDRNKLVDGNGGECGYNPHIAGTYCTALYLLKDEYGWEEFWKKFSEYDTYIQATKVKQHNDGENPLYFVALTNLFKFVTIDREKRTGDENRVWINEEKEKKLLFDEIEILNPDIIFVQSDKFIRDIKNIIKDKNREIIVAPHPSYYNVKGGKNPKVYLSRWTPKVEL